MVRRTVIVIALLLPAAAQAARWGKNGHPEISFDAATSGEFGVPSDVAKVLALGSVAPDYLEFDTYAAHAQAFDPPIGADGRLSVTREEYVDEQRTAYQASCRWHDFYLDAAVTEMRQGHRERAAFLLGYALHNSEDSATHQGMPNLLHAALDKEGASPDEDPRRLAAAHEMASLDLARFRQEVGSDSWALFRGEAVRTGGIGSVVPEPLTTLAPGLSEWDPRSGIIPAPPGAVHEVERAVEGANEAVVSKLVGLYRDFAPKASWKIEDSMTEKAWNTMGGLYARQEAMVALLDVPREAGDPVLPEAKNAVTLAGLLEDGVRFGDPAPLDRIPQFESAPKRYDNLSWEDKQLLADVRWTQFAREELARLRELRAAGRRALAAATRTEIARLAALRDTCRAREAEAVAEQARINRAQAAYRVHQQEVASAGPPQVDGRPQEAPVATAWAGSDDEEESSSSDDDNSWGGSSRDDDDRRDRGRSMDDDSETTHGSIAPSGGEAWGQLEHVHSFGWGGN